MKAMTPPKGKAVIQQDAHELKITLPSWRHWWPMLFGPVWLAGWGVGCVASWIAAGKEPPAAIFGIFGTTIWLAVLTYWLWMCFGHEVLAVQEGQLWHRFELFGGFYTKVYAADDVRRLRSVEASVPWGQWPSGAMAFDWGSKTVRMAAGIDTAEANSLLELLGTWLTR